MFRCYLKVPDGLSPSALRGSSRKRTWLRQLLRLKKRFEKNGKVDLLCDMTDLKGWSLGGFWAELKFDAKHAKDFRRVAVITGKPLHRLMASMLKPFTSAEIKMFSTREKNRRSNLDFPQLIALNVGDFI